MKTRRHHNNKGYRQIKNGGTHRSLQRIIRKLKIEVSMRRVVREEKDVVSIKSLSYKNIYVAKSGGMGPRQSLLIVHEPMRAKYRAVSFEPSSLSTVNLTKNEFPTLEAMVDWLMENGFNVYEFDNLQKAAVCITSTE